MTTPQLVASLMETRGRFAAAVAAIDQTIKAVEAAAPTPSLPEVSKMVAEGALFSTPHGDPA
jgi:hypothetical protein